MEGIRSTYICTLTGFSDRNSGPKSPRNPRLLDRYKLTERIYRGTVSKIQGSWTGRGSVAPNYLIADPQQNFARGGTAAQSKVSRILIGNGYVLRNVTSNFIGDQICNYNIFAYMTG